jgi:hypothetical protein
MGVASKGGKAPDRGSFPLDHFSECKWAPLNLSPRVAPLLNVFCFVKVTNSAIQGFYGEVPAMHERARRRSLALPPADQGEWFACIK